MERAFPRPRDEAVVNRETTSYNSLPRAVLYSFASQDRKMSSFAKTGSGPSFSRHDIERRQTNRPSNAYLRAHHGLTSVPGALLPDVFRIQAVELGDGARLQRSL